MDHKKNITTALAVSIVFHLVLFTGSAKMKIPGLENVIDRTKKTFNLQAINKDALMRPVKRRGVTYANNIKFKRPVRISNLDKAAGVSDPFFDKTVKFEDESSALDKTKGLPENIEPQKMKENVSPLKTANERIRETREDLVDAVDLPENSSSPSNIYSGKDDIIPDDFIEKMPGFTPDIKGGIIDKIKGKVLSKFADNDFSAVRQTAGYADLDEYLICDVYSYTDPEDGEKYFKIGIRAGKDAEKLAVTKKEIIFLIDCSLSIQKERLEEFKKGLKYCLGNLNKEDVFNVMAFREKNLWLSGNSLEPSQENISRALEFVSRLSAGEGTDAYKALYESLRVEESFVPSYIVLFSDGRPTYGITDSRKIINAISDINNGKRPIFAFSGGLRVNRYFLDFISYKNRGWTEYADRTHHISGHIEKMYEKIKDPMLLNLRYRVNGVDNNEIVPKTLPDFYKNAEFTLYGKYGSENKFSLQLLGDIEGKTNEFIVIGELSKAKEGTEEIARNWAFNKIYYLIGLMKYGSDNSSITKEIDKLCEKFDIKTPYSYGIEN